MSQKQTNSQKKSDYEEIYNDIVKNTISVCLREMAEDFKEQYGVCEIPDEDFYKKYSKVFRKNRRNLKDSFYGDDPHHFLNPFKVSAILCRTLIECKAIKFSANKVITSDIIKKNDNLWLANNAFVNFKIAFLSSVGLIYNLALSKLAKDEQKEAESYLIEYQQLINYNVYDECSFQTNIIVHLARNAILGKDFDDLMFALMMFQWYEYSIKYNAK